MSLALQFAAHHRLDGFPGVEVLVAKRVDEIADGHLDAELRGRGVRVAAVEPRYVRTRMFEACAGRMGVPASEAIEPADLAAGIIAMIVDGVGF